MHDLCIDTLAYTSYANGTAKVSTPIPGTDPVVMDVLVMDLDNLSKGQCLAYDDWVHQYMEDNFAKVLRGKYPAYEEFDIADENISPVLRRTGDIDMSNLWTHIDLGAQFSPALELLSRTNPLEPELNLPGNLLETVKDLPRLIYEEGLTLLKLAGGSVLKWEFGWKPLLADLASLLGVGEQVSKRLMVLRDLLQGKAVTRSAAIEKLTDEDSFHIDNALGSLGLDVRRSTVVERWGSVRYTIADIAQEDLDSLNHDLDEWFAVRSLLGLYFTNPATLWEVLPFSWLIDWFVPFQKMLEKYSNIIPLEARESCICTRTTTKFHGQLDGTLGQAYPDVNPDIILEVSNPLEWSGVRCTKERVASNDPATLPSLPVGTSILSTRQWTILLAIAAQRFEALNGLLKRL
nr:MAG: putative maturation protein [Leviviridae sp.]